MKGTKLSRAAMMLLFTLLTATTVWADNIEVTSSTTTFTDGNTYSVTSNVTVSERIIVSGSATLLLCDGYTLTAPKGIGVPAEVTLTINGETDNTGTLTINSCEEYNAGIGGTGNATEYGHIVINGGTINATGGSHGAGIGGGSSNYNNHSSSIVINGGVVNATGGSLAAGIGGGCRTWMGDAYGVPGDITINGGQVSAIGDNSTTGIGKGCNATGTTGSVTLGWTNPTDFIYSTGYNIDNIAFVPGKEFLISGTWAVATATNLVNYITLIPNMFEVTESTTTFEVNHKYYVTSDVTVSERITVDGTAELTLCDGYTLIAEKGIGVPAETTFTINGEDNNTGALTINSCADYHAGIGGTTTGEDSDSEYGHIVINGGTINVTGGKWAAGLGGGCNSFYNYNSSVVINGGVVTATGGENAAGIGGGYRYWASDAYGVPGDITINGGQVTATGGLLLDGGGKIASGIGKGHNTTGTIGSVTLGWTDETDFIDASSYDINTIAFASGKYFYLDGTTTVATTSNIVGGCKLLPLTDEINHNMSYAIVSGLNDTYTYTGSAIEPDYSVTDAYGNTLTENTDYTAVITNSSGTTVTDVTDIDAYTLTITGTGNYTGSNSVRFVVVVSGSIAVTSETTTFEDGNNYYVGSDVTVSERIIVSGTATLLLYDDYTLTAEKGIDVPAEVTLTINGGTNNTGTLTINSCEDYNAGIGGTGNASEYGHIVINGGTINVTGGYNGAGIGGSMDNYNNHSSSVVINGGVVNATGGHRSAGIGGGCRSLEGDAYGVPGDITINGGQVTATGGLVLNGGGEIVSGIGKGYNTTGTTGSVTLGWTNETDFIDASSYDINTIAFASGKYFYLDGTTTVATTSNIVGGCKLLPLTDEINHNMSYAIVSGLNDTYTYTGSAIEPDYSVTDAYGNTLTENTDYTVVITNSFGTTVTKINTQDTYTITFIGAGSYNGSQSLTFNVINNSDLQNATISGLSNYYPYSGEAITFSYTVTDFVGTTLTKDTDYTETITNSSNETVTSVIDKGAYTLTLTGAGSYTGTKTFAFLVKDGLLVTPGTTTFTNGNTYIVANDVIVPERIIVSGSAELILWNNCTLTAAKGIGVPENVTFTINGGSDNTGTLIINNCDDYHAGIGGTVTNYYTTSEYGHIIINGGTINVKGGNWAAGIGGGCNSYDGNSPSIVINGGVVNATGGSQAAGIGGGRAEQDMTRGRPGDITINGGQVTATGGNDSAGIGRGARSETANGSITLGWTNTTDFIDASSYSINSCSFTFVSGKQFLIDGATTIATPENIMSGCKIVPYLETNTFGTEGDWNVADNWTANEVPSLTDDVAINATCTIPSGCVASANSITIVNGSLTIADGGQLITPSEVSGTVQKSITGYSDNTTGWYFVAAPLKDGASAEASNMTPGTFDLYYFDESKNDAEWRNYKLEGQEFDLENTKGYLYANSAANTIKFAGTMKPSNSAVSIDLSYTEGNTMAGWNLVGNPFSCNATVDRAFYKMKDDGSGIEAVSDYENNPIAPCTGIMVQATAASETVTFTRTTADATVSRGILNIALLKESGNRGESTSIDNAIVNFGEGGQLGKLSLFNNNATISFAQGGKEYAVVSSEAQGELPLNFKAENDGTYTLSVEADNAEMRYLHLIDNLTGVDTDLLQTPSYTFTGGTSDYASRFRLVFSAGNALGDENDDHFAFMSDGQLIVTGEGTLNVYDILGREVFSGEISTFHSPLSTFHFTDGVYVLQLVNGNDVKTQKIVIK